MYKATCTLVGDGELAFDLPRVRFDRGLHQRARTRDVIGADDGCLEQVSSGDPVAEHVVHA